MTFTPLGFHQHAVQAVADITQSLPTVMKALACYVDTKSQCYELTHYSHASIKIEPSMCVMKLMSAQGDKLAAAQQQAGEAG